MSPGTKTPANEEEMSAIVRIAPLHAVERLELGGRFARADRDDDRLDTEAGGSSK